VEERSAQLKMENSFRESMSPPGGQRSEKNRRWSVKGWFDRAVKEVWRPRPVPRPDPEDSSGVRGPADVTQLESYESSR
jgi:hypothetical protein